MTQHPRSLGLALLTLGLFTCLTNTAAVAHDTWVQTNTHIVRVGDAVHVDLMLGNHGNEHRDFRLASKIDLASSTLQVIAPSGKKYDLKERAVDTGYAPKEGFWTAKHVTAEPGMYAISHTLDKIVNHGKTIRSIKSGKTFVLASKSLDKFTDLGTGFDQPLGHPLEIVPLANTVAPMGPGQPIFVKVLFQGKPLSDTRVSFIPRSETLSGEFDTTYERKSDKDGKARFTPKTGDYYLVVVHHTLPQASGPGYESTSYSATLTIFVPEVCPCCGE